VGTGFLGPPYYGTNKWFIDGLLALAVLLKENEKFMKKDQVFKNDELRDEYKLSDFPAPLVRGKCVGWATA